MKLPFSDVVMDTFLFGGGPGKALNVPKKKSKKVAAKAAAKTPAKRATRAKTKVQKNVLADQVLESIGDIGVNYNKKKKLVQHEVDDEEKFDLAYLCLDDDFDGLSDEKNDFVANATYQTKDYLGRRHKNLSSFFDAIEKDPKLKILLNEVPKKGFPNKTTLLFWDQLSGKKTEQKCLVLNKCLVLWCMTAMKTSGGDDYQPNTVTTMLKRVFAAFHDGGICFSLSKDFNFQGGLSSVLKNYWKGVKEVRSDFGTRPTS